MVTQRTALEHPLFKIDLAVEEQRHRDVAVLVDIDGDDITQLGIIGDSADRAFVGLRRLEPDLRLVRQQCTAPAARAESADRGQREDAGTERDDRAVRREVVGGAANRRRNQDAIRLYSGTEVEPYPRTQSKC
jgi:hypothetical protein